MVHIPDVLLSQHDIGKARGDCAALPGRTPRHQLEVLTAVVTFAPIRAAVPRLYASLAAGVNDRHESVHVGTCGHDATGRIDWPIGVTEMSLVSRTVHQSHMRIVEVRCHDPEKPSFCCRERLDWGLAGHL